MCGIAGIADFSGRGVDERIVASMCAAICHRGPDDHGLMAFRSAGAASAVLGSQRLSIIDVAGGHQPIANEDESIWTVLNGEIYNFAALRARLEASGHQFATRSDTEVIVHLYEEMGPDFVGELDGMFALALWDRANERLVLARDRFGKKPLLYADRGGRLSFASEFTGLLVDGGIDTSLDSTALDYYLTFMSVPAPHTIYRGIRKLPPAHRLVRDRAGLRIEPYWRLSFAPKSRLSEGEAIERFHELFRAAVQKRLISEVPLGAFLSGGIDSSAVVAVMAKLADAPVKAFSIGFGDSSYNELPHARRVAQAFNCEHHEFVVEPRAVDVLPTLVRHYGEPFADSSAIPSYYLARLTRQHVTVALNGDGGDESFGGYRRYRLHLMEEQMRSALPMSVRKPVFGLLGRMYPKADWAPRPLRARSTFEALARDSVGAYFHSVSLMRDDMRRKLFSDTFRRDLGGYSAFNVFERHAATAQTDDPLALIQYLDLKTYLPGDINTKVDRASMAHSLETREPLMDHPLVEWLGTLPSSVKVRGQEGKWLLKKAMEPRLSQDVLYRQKMGFAVPLAKWFRGPLRTRLRDAVLGERLAGTGYFNRAYLTELLDHHQSGRRDYSAPLWSLLMFDAFLRQNEKRAPD